MPYQWTGWEQFGGVSEYIHWFLKDEPGEERIAEDNAAEDGLTLCRQSNRGTASSPIIPPASVSGALFGNGLPVPPQAVNAGFPPDNGGAIDWLPGPSVLPGDLSDDTIVMGVIDVGIPLGHHRWRMPDGASTRVLAAWQMLAQWDVKSQPYLPFGREVYAHDINKGIARHTKGKWFDQREFDIETGVLDPVNANGPRQVQRRASHGAHVMDLAAGADHDAADETDFIRRVRPIVVNVPSASTFGAPGTYLDDFLRLAVQRVIDLSDAIWMKHHAGYKHDEDGDCIAGYPIVINMSFGKQAGAKDFLDPFSAWLRDIQEARKRKKLSGLFIVMPAGNDNLTKCNAFLEPEGKRTLSLPWRIIPDDQSSNFTEIWTRLRSQTDFPVRLLLHSPDNDAIAPPEPLTDRFFPDIRFCDLKRDGRTVARIYAARKEQKIDDQTYLYLKYTIAQPPTYRLDGDDRVGLAGLWRIELENLTDERIQSVLSIQTDQQLSPNRSGTQRSYFDEKNYDDYDDRGRVVASYKYPPDEVANWDLCADTPVRRHGTINASAAHDAIACIGGYRVWDGRPADYSSTGRGRRPENGKPSPDDGTIVPRKGDFGARRAPTASMPTEDTPSHFGILASGSFDGTVAAMRGTSFASAQAAKVLAHDLMADPAPGRDAEERLEAIARDSEDAGWPHGYHPRDPELVETLGRGRIRTLHRTRVSRLD